MGSKHQTPPEAGPGAEQKITIFSVPGAPTILPEQCVAENNTVTIAWGGSSTSLIDGYVLEIDSGNNDGVFKVRLTFALDCIRYVCLVM